MKRFLSILLAAASLLAFCSCSDSTPAPHDGGETGLRSANGERSLISAGGGQSLLRDNVDSGQKWSKDFDGAVLTVTTDKSEYKLGEEINLTASVKNNTDRDIGIYVPTSTENSHMEIETSLVRDGKRLFDPDAPWLVDCCTAVVKLKPGEEYVQNERRITFILKDSFPEEFEFAPVGEYKGSSGFILCDPDNSSSLGEWNALEFSITLVESGEPAQMYQIPPREDPGLRTSHYHKGFVFEAETAKSVYRPGEPITVNIRVYNGYDCDLELVSGFSSVFPHEEWGAVYPWADEDDIIEKRALPEGRKLEQGGELTETFVFDCLTEPGEYTFDFSADIRYPDGSVENHSFIFPVLNIVEDN